LRDQGLRQNFHGWLGGVEGNFNKWFGLATEVGGNYWKLPRSASEINESFHSFAGGPRFSSRTNSAATPFAHLLLGADRASLSTIGLGVGGHETDFILQPGGGVDIWVTPKLGIRLGSDYRRLWASGGGVNEFRFTAGMVFGFGHPVNGADALDETGFLISEDSLDNSASAGGSGTASEIGVLSRRSAGSLYQFG